MKTEKLFETLRTAPVDIPLDKIEQIVITGATTGAFAAGAGFWLKKTILGFHLNSISIMITASAATAISIGATVLFSSAGSEKKSASVNTKEPETATIRISGETDKSPENAYQLTATDTPQTNANSTPVLPSRAIYIYSSDDSLKTITTRNGNTTTVTIISADSGMHVVAAPVAVACSRSGFAYAYASPDSGWTEAIAPEAMEALAKAEREMEQARAEMKRAPARAKAPQAPDATNLASAEAELERARAELAKANANMAAPEAQREVMQAACAAKAHCQTDTLRQLIEENLLRDGLISNKNKFLFELNGKEMRVNGVKQSEANWAKYRNLIESKSKMKVNRKFEYRLQVSGDSMSIDIENDN